ncbi:MAG: DUF4197 domain-containing protein [Bacteroidota bacterium]
MKKISSLLLIVLFCLPSCSTLQSLIAEPTSLETISALREVLNSSTFRAISTLSKINKDGVMAILPSEIQPVLNTLKTVGLGNEIDKATEIIGNVSGEVAKESGGIMKDAIAELDFGDAVSVVLGGEDAATQVLKQAMYGSVKKRYSSRLETELGKTEVLKYWPMASGAYNLFAKNKVNSSLPDFLSERAVDALFLTMGKEESKIRQKPEDLGKAVVTKVFNYYQNQKK